ncbi:MAG: DMT family transporter [Rhodospirillum sp.]|nr:DMT family transporter [Rhodospirillum sp.]MCF8489311.1 DMT family transporter [Rhodospirillum sp.]MCF8500261.1 DMT family transporter [Rhodospirillum sp.]
MLRLRGFAKRNAGPGLGIACLIAATLIFAFQDAVTKHLSSHYPVPFIVMLRYWAFALFAMTIARRQAGGLSGALRCQRPILQSLRGVLLVAEIACMAMAFRFLGLAETQAVFSIYPLLIMAMAIPILGERVGWRRALATGVGFIGLLVILRPGLEAFDPAALFAVSAALLYALYNVLTRLVSGTDSAATTILFTAVVGALISSLSGPWFWAEMPAADWGWTALLALFGITAHVLLIKALEFTPASVLQPFNYLLLVWSVGVGYLVFGDIPDFWTVLGGALIVGSGLYVLYRDRVVKQSRVT